jgi:hypothetical protein
MSWVAAGGVNVNLDASRQCCFSRTWEYYTPFCSDRSGFSPPEEDPMPLTFPTKRKGALTLLTYRIHAIDRAERGCCVLHFGVRLGKRPPPALT